MHHLINPITKRRKSRTHQVDSQRIRGFYKCYLSYLFLFKKLEKKEKVILSDIFIVEETIDLESDHEDLAEEESEVRVCDWKNCGADATGLKDLVAHVNSKHVQVN